MTGDQRLSDGLDSLHQQLDVNFALQAAGLGVWEYNPGTGLVNWDQRARALFGIAEGNQMPYEQAVQFIHADDFQRVDEAVRWALTPQSDGAYDQTYRTLGVDDGQLRWVRFMGRSYFTESGHLRRFSGVAQDVTPQVTNQQQISSNEARFTDLVATSPAATVIFVGREMLIKQVNAPMLTIWGKEAAAVLGKTLHVAMPELDGQPFLAQLQRVYDTGEPFRHEEGKAELIEDGQQKTVWFNHAYNPLYNQNGQVYGVINTAIDVTDQVVARRRLTEREAQLRTIINAVPIAIALFSGRSLTLEMANRASIDLMGEERTVEGKTLAAIMPELDNQSFLQLMDDVFTTQQPYRGYAAPIHVLRNGVDYHEFYNINYIPLLNEAGQTYAVLNIAMDVTNQVIARQQLEEKEIALGNTIELAELGTFSVDVATNRLTASPRIIDWFGFDNQTADTGAFIAGVGEHERDYVQTSLYNTLLPGSDGRYDVVHSVINAKTGHQRIVHALGRVYFDTTGQPVRIEGTAQDITVERELQLVLEQQVKQRTDELATSNRELAANNEELAEANALLTRSNENLQQFAYVASHDLQEPLRKIQSFGDLLKAHYAADSASQEFLYLDRMQIAAARMSTLIRDLLSFSRIATQRNTNVPVSLSRVIDEVLNVLDMAIDDVQAQVTVDALPTVSGDATQLRQLFQNLLSNALKFCRPDVPPHIRISSQTLAADVLPALVKPGRRTDQYVRIDVADNGIGFDEKYLDRIFQVFQRLHSRNEYSGTGIGLAICEKVVTNHGGTITASSTPGEGTTFSIYLPN